MRCRVSRPRLTIYKIAGFLVFYITISPITIYSSSTLQACAYVGLLCILFSLCRQGSFDQRIRKVRLIAFFFFFLAFAIPIFVHGETPFITDFFQWSALLLIVSLKERYRISILTFALKLSYVLMALAIIEYLLGYFLSWTLTIANMNYEDAVYSQSFFNLYRYGDLHYRFQSIFSEPGELGAFCGFFIAFLPFKKEYIRQLLVFTFAGIISLSLAFYIYLIFILIFRTLNGSFPIKYFLVSIVCLALSLFIFREAVSKAIVERVTERDIESVDNRTSERVNGFMENLFTSTQSIYGVGNRTAYALEKGSGHGNAGLKWKLFQYGIFGVGFYFLGMYCLLRRRRNTNVSMMFCLIFFGLYFYAVGAWGIPIFMLLLFTTLPENPKGVVLV